jgi:CHASE3 domain sensor protein
MNPNNPTPDELQARIRQLEDELARVKTERDLYKKSVYEEMMASIPYTPMTLEEARELMSAPQGERLTDIIAEYEKELDGRE